MGASHSPNFCAGDYTVSDGSVKLDNGKYYGVKSISGALVGCISVDPADVVRIGSVSYSGQFQYNIGGAFRVMEVGAIEKLKVDAAGLYLLGETTPIASHQQAAKVWVRAEQANISGGYGVSTITDIGGNKKRVSFITAQADANYAVDAYIENLNDDNTHCLKITARTTGYLDLEHYVSGTLTTYPAGMYYNVKVHGA